MQKWEHKVMVFREPQTTFSDGRTPPVYLDPQGVVSAALSEMGKDGWELVSAQSIGIEHGGVEIMGATRGGDQGRYYELYFAALKRPIE
jgi:hypothetical protein